MPPDTAALISSTSLAVVRQSVLGRAMALRPVTVDRYQCEIACQPLKREDARRVVFFRAWHILMRVDAAAAKRDGLDHTERALAHLLHEIEQAAVPAMFGDGTPFKVDDAIWLDGGTTPGLGDGFAVHHRVTPDKRWRMALYTVGPRLHHRFIDDVGDTSKLTMSPRGPAPPPVPTKKQKALFGDP